MRDFFARQEDARRRSVQLVVFLGVAVLCVGLAVYLVAALVSIWLFPLRHAGYGLWQPTLFAWTTTGTLLFVTAASFLKMQELKGGGAAVAAALGARPVPLQPRDPRELLLRNVVEEMAIASGVPVPDLYLLERERSINAFAAGHDPDDAAICVTRGSVELLSRDELQGVVAHEFSHILNGDMLLNMRMVGWLNGILVVSQFGDILLRGVRHGSGRAAGPLLALGATLYAIGYVGYFFGQLIRCAVSRQREYLGDASAVQFTRNPGGLAGALKKIGGLSMGSRLHHPRAAEVSHMFFGNVLEDAWLHALDTHPPLDERLRRLDPRFRGIYPHVEPLAPPAPDPAPLAAKPVRAASGGAAPLSGAAVLAMLEQVGEPMQEHLHLARRMLGELPPPVLTATRDPLGACALVYGLMLDCEMGVRARQEELVQTHDGAAMAGEVRRLAPDLDSLPPQVRLPLVDLSLPALRSLGPEQFRRLKTTSEALAAADGRETLFEFAIRHLIMRRLEPRFFPRPVRPVQIYNIRGVQKESSRVLSTLARVGHGGDEEAASAAFARGALVLKEPKAEFSFLPPSQCRKFALEEALIALEGTSPQVKRRLLAACLECLVHDGVVKTGELELFRAFADALGCPVPPWLDLCPGASSRGATV